MISRCNKCFECPRCESNISVFSLKASDTTSDDKDRIEYYYSCSYCRWDSRSIDLLDDSAESLNRA